MFQKSILKKYLAQLPAASVRAAWERFTDYFLNPEIQRLLRSGKEEQLQGEFLMQLFGEILGYTLYPKPNFNLVREQKNITNARSADGAILKDQKVFAVIELKDTNTRDLTRIEDQAFGYKNAHPGVNYVVISNFEELRFYIDSTVNHVDFNLFTMTESDFRLLYFCLAAESLLKDAPLHAKQETVSAEVSITEKLYGDYSRFKRALFDDLCRRNADRGLDPLQIFRMTQKLLDRLVFIFFCEDRGLLPPNSIAKIITSWREQTIWNPRPLYEQFKSFFGFVNAGQPQLGIFAYNGGLFAPDELLDSLQIDDELLAEHTQKLSAYDFESEVDVNILGHIFEHSLTEIEEIKNTGTTLPASLKNTETTLPASSLETQDLNSTDDAGSVVPVIVPVRYHDRYFNPDMPIDKTQGNLPHWDQTEKLQFVTFRLADSLPQERVREWSDERERWLAAHPKPWDEETEKQYYQDFEQKIDKWLDKGYGSCVLSSPDLRKIVADAILFFDNQRYIVESFVIMPNHVHVLLEVINGYELGEILHSWKSFTANKINKVLNLTGPFWQKESYDTIIRGLKHFQYVSGYIKANADCVPKDKVTYYYRYGQKYGDDASSVVKKTKLSDDAGRAFSCTCRVVKINV